ncbi:hypothetical protein ACIBIZ_38765 [Nonomuraea spiralis]|uniref:hypothetical protein n=1 Tax=Nonomuraea spiralis TaxID=46182 RepID=UPI0037BC22BE
MASRPELPPAGIALASDVEVRARWFDPVTGGRRSKSVALAVLGLEPKRRPLNGRGRKRVAPTLGHLPVRVITNGAVDRLAILVRVMEQAVRDGITDRSPTRMSDSP